MNDIGIVMFNIKKESGNERILTKELFGTGNIFKIEIISGSKPAFSRLTLRCRFRLADD